MKRNNKSKPKNSTFISIYVIPFPTAKTIPSKETRSLTPALLHTHSGEYQQFTRIAFACSFQIAGSYIGQCVPEDDDKKWKRRTFE